MLTTSPPKAVSTAVKEAIQSSYSAVLATQGFRPRGGQKHMIAAIARTLSSASNDMSEEDIEGQRFLVIEAGTGVGKTVAYLIPALISAMNQGKKLVVSTATATLQEQLLAKDLPTVVSAVSEPVQFGLVKGRRRYLCQANLDLVMHGGGSDAQISYFDEGHRGLTASAAKVYQELSEARRTQQWDGDRDHWPEAIADNQWYPITSDRRACTGPRCPDFEGCAFYEARDRVTELDCLIVNHDLILSDLGLGGGVILPNPEDCIYIFDEAHHLVDKARQHLSARIGLTQAAQSLDEMERGFAEIAALQTSANVLRDPCMKCAAAHARVGPPLTALIKQVKALESNKNSEILRFIAGVIEPELIGLCSDLLGPARKLLLEIEALQTELDRNAEKISLDRETMASIMALCGDWLARVEGWVTLLADWANGKSEQNTGSARWIRYSNLGGMELFSSPIKVGANLHESLWQRASSAVFTSATLGVAGDFRPLLADLGLPAEVPCESIPSPFDYANLGLLEICADAPDPTDNEAFEDYFSRLLEDAIDPQAGTLVLFSSIRQLENVRQMVRSGWMDQVLVQGDIGRAEIVRRHKERVDQGQGSTIFGLRSFAEGVDLPGNYCSHLIIARLPFSVPDDPVEATLAELVKARGGNPFTEISLPGAAVRLVQAVGRLIRSETDRGKITVADPRLANRRYSGYLRSALPPFKIVNRVVDKDE